MRALIGVIACSCTAFAGMSWKTTLGIEGNWDNNIADNITHVSEPWATPYASIYLKQGLKGNRSLSFQTDLRYESYFDKRSPTLNSPLDQYTLKANQDFGKDLSLSIVGRAARTYDADWRMVKILGRAGFTSEWSPANWKASLDINHDWENYGDHAQDGNTNWYMFDVRYDLWKGVQVGWGYTIEDRQSYSPSYTYVNQTWETKMRIPIAKAILTLDCGRAYKMYSTNKRNQEWLASALLTMTFGNWKVKSDLSGKNTESNQPGYSWSEKTASTSVDWTAESKAKAKPKSKKRMR